jgi:hypothetical protein
MRLGSLIWRWHRGLGSLIWRSHRRLDSLIRRCRAELNSPKMVRFSRRSLLSVGSSRPVGVVLCGPDAESRWRGPEEKIGRGLRRSECDGVQTCREAVSLVQLQSWSESCWCLTLRIAWKVWPAFYHTVVVASLDWPLLFYGYRPKIGRKAVFGIAATITF